MNLIKQHCFLQWEAHYIFLQVSLAETQATCISCESKAHTHIIALNKFNLQRMMPLFGGFPHAPLPLLPLHEIVQTFPRLAGSEHEEHVDNSQTWSAWTTSESLPLHQSGMNYWPLKKYKTEINCTMQA